MYYIRTMKKLLIGIGILLLIVVGICFFNPGILFAFPQTQHLGLLLEGDRSAEFYFKPDQKNRDTIYMKGVICSTTLKDIKAAFDNAPEVTTLVMEDVPGSIDDVINLEASKEIRNRGINTYIPENGMVASGGTDMFLAGKLRDAHDTAKFGVHSWGGENDSVALDFPRDDEEHVKYLDYYREMEIPEEFYWYTLEAAPADDIHWMTNDELAIYDVLNAKSPSLELLRIQEELASDEFEGREAGKNEKAQNLILDYFESIGLQKFNNSYTSSFHFEHEETKEAVEGTNIIGFVKGNTYPDKYIVIGAHYDHLGVRDSVIYNGADDNASGTSALLVMGKYFSQHQPEHSIIFAAFDAEEMGLWGSRYFVSTPPVSLSSIVLNINMDMISRNPKNEIYVVGTHQYPQFKPLIAEVGKTLHLTISYGHDDPNDTTKDYWMESSDNGSFFEKDIPNITFSEEDHPGYHKPTDDFEFIDQEFYKNVHLLVQKSIIDIDKNFPTKE